MPQNRREPKVPQYRQHKASGQARVILNGQHLYLGKFGSRESLERYHRLIAEQLTGGQSTVIGAPAPHDQTIAVDELILPFMLDAERRYVKNGRPTSEVRSFRTALEPVHKLYGQQPVTSFGPLALRACRQCLVNAGYTRRRINGLTSRIRHVFKWGVGREMVDESVWRALCAVEPLRVGEGKETKPITAVTDEHVQAIAPYVSPQIWGLVQLQLLTACRPGEACLIRGADISMAAAIWEYRPPSHKTEHHAKERVIYLGPQAQAVLRPWLVAPPQAYLFSPREAMRWHRAQRSSNQRRTRTTQYRRRKSQPMRVPGERYMTHAYDHAIRRACKRAGVPSWRPNQLRHAAATRIRAAYGIELARIILGHSSAVTSEIYAEEDRQKARDIMQSIG